jgi:hypothetical protein
MVPGWFPFKIVSDSSALHSRWLLLLKIEIYSIVHCCFSISQNELKFELQQISIFSNSSHLECRAELSDTILKGNHPGTIPARFGVIWFSGFRGKDLDVIIYQNMSSLHNRYKSAEKKISQKNPGIYNKLLISM